MAWLQFALVLSAVVAACTPPAAAPRLSPASAELAVAESLYADLRAIRDRIQVSRAADRSGAASDTTLAPLMTRHNGIRRQLSARLGAIDSSSLGGDDARALGIMRRTLARDLDLLSALPEAEPDPAALPDCTYDAAAIARLPNGLDSLRQRVYACYRWSQSHVVAEGDTLDRLTVLGLLGRVDDAGQRQRLFRALEPVWRSVNRDNGPNSPYRQLVDREGKERRGQPPAAEQARASGVPPDSLESWLQAVLQTWRAANPDSLIEPWDWYYLTGQAGRRLSPRISRERLTTLNSVVYRSLGANLERLGIHYDLDPREGKTPVAFTDFGGRPRYRDGTWQPGAPWVFATYRTGGLDNLNELLHETGHAVHIAAIRTRPAFADWPDSDPFTEAIADQVALDVYEPAWQWRWLGDSVPLAEGLRGRYGGIVLDIAWALFEVRMLREPKADPNSVWTELTRDYLRIRPHPELSWWAMRAQLIDAPGYMMNYAAGAFLSAAIRARTRAAHRAGSSTWYGWMAPRLFRFGLERPSKEVIEEFLGGPVSPGPLLEDMRRMRE